MKRAGKKKKILFLSKFRKKSVIFYFLKIKSKLKMAEQQQNLFRDMTRATQYQVKHTLPQNFSAVLKEFTREVLREQPSDLLQWSAEYFKRMALENDPSAAEKTSSTATASKNNNAAGKGKANSSSAGGGAAVDPEFAAVAQEMIELFSRMDEGGDRRLYAHIVQRALLDHLELSKEQALYILSSPTSDGAAAAQRGDDGMIDFVAFANSAAKAVVYFQQTKHAFKVPAGVTSVHGFERDELRDALLRVFREADASEGLGRLTFAKFRDALVHAPLQLTSRDINVLCAEAEQTSDGFVDVRREAEHAFPLLCLSGEFTKFDQEHD
jgi:hypothetical protein